MITNYSNINYLMILIFNKKTAYFLHFYFIDKHTWYYERCFNFKLFIIYAKLKLI